VVVELFDDVPLLTVVTLLVPELFEVVTLLVPELLVLVATFELVFPPRIMSVPLVLLTITNP